MIRAGTPATTEYGVTSDVTTAFAPMIDPAPIVTPGITTALVPSQQSPPIVIGQSRAVGVAREEPFLFADRQVRPTANGCSPDEMKTFGARMHHTPIEIDPIRLVRRWSVVPSPIDSTVDVSR